MRWFEARWSEARWSEGRWSEVQPRARRITSTSATKTTSVALLTPPTTAIPAVLLFMPYGMSSRGGFIR